MKRFFIVLVAALFPFCVLANPIDDKCPQFVLGKAPETTQQLDYLCHKDYAVAFDETAKIPRYTVELLSKEHEVKNVPRSNSFKEDPTEKVQALVSDYSHSGYDKGHMTPDGDFVYDVTSESESFFMTNMVPQVPGNNRGIWKHLEEHLRALATTYGKIYVVSGTVYSSTSKKITDSVVVPDKLWKIAYFNGTYEAYLVPNEKENDSLDDYKTDLKTIEGLTGLTFEDVK